MNILRYIKSRVFYVRLVGLILFLTGLLGFAFRGNDPLPGLLLLGCLVLGFWGLVLGASRRPDGMDSQTYEQTLQQRDQHNSPEIKHL